MWQLHPTAGLGNGVSGLEMHVGEQGLGCPSQGEGQPWASGTFVGTDRTSACTSVLAPRCPWWGGLWQNCGLASYSVTGAWTDGPGLG